MSLSSKLLKQGAKDVEDYVNEGRAVKAELRKAIDLRKVSSILSEIEDLSNTDLPEEVKEKVLIKLNAMLDVALAD